MIVYILLTFITTINFIGLFYGLFNVDGEEIVDFGKHFYVVRFELGIGLA
jgi:hypothetical protein